MEPCDPSSGAADPLLSVLRERFGLQDFRAPQRDIIQHVLAGHSALAIMPTGSGKSLTYQLPALLLEGRTLVLSPLIALMKDQVDALRRKGIPASFVNSSLDRAERERRTQAFVRGKTPLLYVTPERFRSPTFREAVSQVTVSLLAVDEAHCITEWGHDFRPDYSRIAPIREFLGNPATLALTATATPEVQEEILRLLGIPDARRFHTGIERPNLFLAAHVCLDESEKWRRVEQRLEQLPGAGILYGALVRDLHRLEEHLTAQGRRLHVYHGQLSPEERRRMQERFMAGEDTRVLATPAFGMGVDKADIRFLLHHQVPGSVESYYQEVGRAGRDGRPSLCELLYCEDDLPIQVQFIEWANPPAGMLSKVAHLLTEWGEDIAHFEKKDLEGVFRSRGADGRVDTCLQWLETLGVIRGSFEGRDLEVLRPLEPDEIPAAFRPEKKQRDLRRLLSLVEYVRTEECRRAWLCRYFGLPEPDGPCGACDRCADLEGWREANLPFDVDLQPKSLREPGAAAAAEDAVRLPERGDFVRINGRLLGRVLRVSGPPGRAQVEVELSRDLDRRTFRQGRDRIQVLPPGEDP